MAVLKLIPESLQRQARTASPPMPVGSIWLKNHPTKRILSRTEGPTVFRSGRIKRQRDALKGLVAANAAAANTNQPGEPPDRIFAIRPVSSRDSRAAKRPTVTTSRTAIVKNLVMPLTGYRLGSKSLCINRLQHIRMINLTVLRY